MPRKMNNLIRNKSIRDLNNFNIPLSVEATTKKVGNAIQINNKKPGKDSISAIAGNRKINMDNGELIVKDRANNPVVISKQLGETNKYKSAIKGKSKEEIDRITEIFAERAKQLGDSDNKYLTGGEIGLIGAGINLIGGIFGGNKRKKARREALAELDSIKFPELTLLNENINKPLFRTHRDRIMSGTNSINKSLRNNMSSSNAITSAMTMNRVNELNSLSDVSLAEINDYNQIRSTNVGLRNQYGQMRYNDRLSRINTKLGAANAGAADTQSIFGAIGSGISQYGEMKLYNDTYGYEQTGRYKRKYQ